MNAPDIWAAIEHAYAHEDVLADAQRRWAAAAPNLFHPHKVELSASSAGACVLERWAYLHGMLDLPESAADLLAKMDGGSMYGARVAALFAAGYEATHPNATVEIELVSTHDGIPGHLDIKVSEWPDKGDAEPEPLAVWVIELKTSFWTGAFSGPMDGHLIQACKYALGQGAEGFTIGTILPGARKTKGALAINFVQNDYYTADYAAATRAEYARLRAAANDDPPEPDAKEGWRCEKCRFSQCAKNKNPLREGAAA